MKRGNPRPSIAVDHRAQRPFNARRRIVLQGNANLGGQFLVYRSPSFETLGYSSPEVFAAVTIHSTPPPTFALIGQLVSGMGSPGAPGPISAIGSGLPWLGKGVSGPGTYALPIVGTGAPGTPREVFATEAWFELWALGNPRGYVLDVSIEGTLVAGWSYST